ncbi:MAG: serine/threonine protein kinase [Oscillospiraceae bacterium]|jgi:serine/threonine-protein kinase|nr:serine/threonine protein kinase [Oscillospiraceae bacterium]
MVNYNLDGVCFSLKSEHDFSWLKSLGTVFAVFSQNDSGNISFGVNSGREKYFVKAAGLNTLESSVTTAEAIETLRSAAVIYENIKHPNLIELVKHCRVDDIYIAVFKWAEGDCLFDYWNFEKYQGNSQIIAPAERFKRLPAERRIKSADILFSFLDKTSKSGYAAVDFYDGSIMYDFSNNTTTICDIDFFRKKPTFNDIGEDYWGTKRLKAPEEYILNAVIDEVTNVYTLGALLFNNYFGNYTESEVQLRYAQNRFTPCSFEKWDLNKQCYEAALKAVEPDRSKRYQSIENFHRAWTLAMQAK